MTKEIKSVRFANIAEFDAWLESGEPSPDFKAEKKENSHRTGLERKEFTGTWSWYDARKLMLYGDTELAKAIEEQGVVKASKKTFATRPKSHVTTNFVGFQPNIPAYLAGAKKQMFRIEKKPVRQRVITIVYEGAVHCGIAKEEVIKTASNLMKAIMQIEAGGTRVNLYVAYFAISCGRIVASSVKIKDSGQYIDLLKMCYPLIHASMFRRQGFRVIEKLGDRSFTFGYGIPLSDVKGRRGLEETALACGFQKGTFMTCFNEIKDLNTEQIIKHIYESKI